MSQHFSAFLEIPQQSIHPVAGSCCSLQSVPGNGWELMGLTWPGHWAQGNFPKTTKCSPSHQLPATPPNTLPVNKPGNSTQIQLCAVSVSRRIKDELRKKIPSYWTRASLSGAVLLVWPLPALIQRQLSSTSPWQDLCPARGSRNSYKAAMPHHVKSVFQLLTKKMIFSPFKRIKKEQVQGTVTRVNWRDTWHSSVSLSNSPCFKQKNLMMCIQQSPRMGGGSMLVWGLPQICLCLYRLWCCQVPHPHRDTNQKSPWKLLVLGTPKCAALPRQRHCSWNGDITYTWVHLRI